MLLYYLNHWLLFAVMYSLLLLVSFVMMRQSAHFYTYDVVVRKFSIMELEMPATPTELRNVIKGVFSLRPPDAATSLKALRGQLWLDFLFMPLAYGCLFLLCWRIAGKVAFAPAAWLYALFAYGQVIPWLCDIIENVLLLSQLKPDVTEISIAQHRQLLWMEVVKWGFALLSLACALGAMAYFWCTGNYSITSLYYLCFVVLAGLIFLVVARIGIKNTEAPKPPDAV